MKRPIKEVVFSSRFEKEFDRLPREIQELAHKKDRKFRADAFNPSLETHKLSGKFEGDWAYSVNRSYRVHFRFLMTTPLHTSISAHMRFINNLWTRKGGQ